MKKETRFLGVVFSLLFLCGNSHGQTIPLPWSWPLTSDFGPRQVADGTWFHQGVDYNAVSGDADLGTPIPAVEAGDISGIATRGDFYNINVTGAGTGQTWLYGHIFRVGELVVNNWELRFNAKHVNPVDTNDVAYANIIIQWTDSTRTHAAKILSTIPDRWISAGSDYVSASNDQSLLTRQ